MFLLSNELGENENVSVVPMPYNGEWMICCFPTEYNDPSFTLYHGALLEHDKKARISIKEPKYIHCTDDPTAEWNLTDDEKLKLMNVLKSPSEHGYSIWENILRSYKREMDNWAHFKFDVPMDYPIPDYTKLKV